MAQQKAAKISSKGSALILAVVLTSMLAVVGILFIVAGRLESTASSAVSENRDLDLAVDSVVAQIKETLADDVPRVPVREYEYYDYPGPNDPWLAPLEPYMDSGNYYWSQVSLIKNSGFSSGPVQAEVISDNQPAGYLQPADADGDGIADANWVELENMTSSKGRPIFAAVRVVDNGGMLNVNTAYKFDPNLDPQLTDGSSQMQINLMALSQRDNTYTDWLTQKEDRLWEYRCGNAPNSISIYEDNVVWRYYTPLGDYTPFDISDELKLRNRYILNNNKISTRIEKLWTNAYDGGPEVPLPTESYNLDRWFDCTNLGVVAPNDYDYRHISTTYNMDRIIPPRIVPGISKQVDVNTPDVGKLYTAVTEALRDAGVNPGLITSWAAQMAVNIKDYQDPDSKVTIFNNPHNGFSYYGFDTPCVYLSELVYKQEKIEDTTYHSYGFEFHKPYPQDVVSPTTTNATDSWELVVTNSDLEPVDVNWTGTDQFHVMIFESSDLLSSTVDFNQPDVNDVNTYVSPGWIEGDDAFRTDSVVRLVRNISDISGTRQIVVDSVNVPPGLLSVSGDSGTKSYQRDIRPHKCIHRQWGWPPDSNNHTLGYGNKFTYSSLPDIQYIQAHPHLDPNIYDQRHFKNIGEIGKAFRISAYLQGGPPWNRITPNLDTPYQAKDVLIDLTNTQFQPLFNWLTVFDPTSDSIDNDGDDSFDEYDTNSDGYAEPGAELKIPGRININTAPWFVIAQLPWVQLPDPTKTYTLAQAIANYRDNVGGFRNIGQLMDASFFNTSLMDYYIRPAESGDQAGMPDLTPNDGAVDDMEERDLIFQRISNLATVRSDVFTAYILVRIGTEGPQRRVIAILDRSDVYPDGPDGTIGKVKVRALYPVPDPR